MSKSTKQYSELRKKTDENILQHWGNCGGRGVFFLNKKLYLI